MQKLAACTNDQFAPQPTAEHPSFVIGGKTDPSEFGFEIHPLQANATLGQIATVGGNEYQGCSATLIGDRIVLTAAHCTVKNQTAWFNNTAPPDVADASEMSYVVGTDQRAAMPSSSKRDSLAPRC